MTRWRVTVILVGAALVGCGGGGGGSGLRCLEIEPALVELDEGRQVLQQLQFEHVYEEIRAGEREFDPDALADAIATLRAVEAIEVGQDGIDLFGSAEEGLDLFERANDLARESLTLDNPLAEPSGQELAALVDDLVVLIDANAAIQLAADIGGCDVPRSGD